MHPEVVHGARHPCLTRAPRPARYYNGKSQYMEIALKFDFKPPVNTNYNNILRLQTSYQSRQYDLDDQLIATSQHTNVLNSKSNSAEVLVYFPGWGDDASPIEE